MAAAIPVPIPAPDSPTFIALVQATAGAVGGVFAAFVLMPIEVAKTRIQLSDRAGLSTFIMMKEIVSEESVPGLFCGSFAKCFETGSKNFVYFYIYDAINALAKKALNQVHLTTGWKLALGYIAGVGNTIATMPLEVIATKVQAESKKHESLPVVVKRVLDKEGIRGLFKGFWYNIMLCVNPAIQNTVFDKCKDALMLLQVKAGKVNPSLTPFQAFALGAFAKAVATVITYPLVRLKTILQAGKEMKHEEDKEPVSLQWIIKKFFEFYRGVGSALMKSVSQAALLYMTKDQVADLVSHMFVVTAQAFHRKGGDLKLGATSGRPLAS
eukprot:CAMPEP_0206480948 /NCGR_PEP_ID=MMETSP0324_2-20121206/37779_1 /ASSEMBLY_ACC=CAM_ASM_000836 /TAXON_ID=2866 /ORGANISM="Crypthecodinium cohnii, Strain Seligo" /LENGTH=325 /DNA_ID=CAMNT_0053958195 /DNA_START=122 /DNA_END=1099 /DNA_ORIENTATION=-